MAALKNHFDGGSPSISDAASDGTWLSTYSRGLCSMYHNDEDHCWDAILCTQSPNAFAALPDDSSQQPSLQDNRHHHHHHRHERHNQSHNNTTDFSDIGMEPASRDSALEDADVGAQLVPTSPGSGLSRALCNFGFSCIDFVTGDNLGSSEPISSAHHYHHHWDRTLSSHDPTVDSAHTLVTTTREDGLEADSMILEDKKRSSSWARRVWRAL